MINIIAGEGEKQKTFKVQEALLRTTSPVFAAALRNEHLGESERGVLRFPEDDGEAWKLLLFWIFKCELPDYSQVKTSSLGECDRLLILFVHCWILGDKYQLPKFQDLIMLELLLKLQDTTLRGFALQKAVETTPPGSKLRQLAVRETVFSAIEERNGFEGYEAALNTVGFGLEVVQGIERWREEGEETEYDFGTSSGEGRNDIWEQFMVAGGPGKHWIHNKDCEE